MHNFLHLFIQKISVSLSLCNVSENYVKPETEYSGCADIVYGRDEPFRIEKLFLSGPDNLYVRRQLQPRRYGHILVRLKPILISQKGSGGSKHTGECRVTDYNVVVPYTKLIVRTRGNDTFAAHSKAEEKMHGVRIAV